MCVTEFQWQMEKRRSKIAFSPTIIEIEKCVECYYAYFTWKYTHLTDSKMFHKILIRFHSIQFDWMGFDAGAEQTFRLKSLPLWIIQLSMASKWHTPTAISMDLHIRVEGHFQFRFHVTFIIEHHIWRNNKVTPSFQLEVIRWVNIHSQSPSLWI